MSTQPTTKVRLVRCPRCRQVLAELPDVPLYTCGGCGTILQAKNRKNESNDANARLQETDTIVNTEQGHVSEEKEETGSNRDLTPPLSGESSPEKDKTGDHGEHDKSFSDEISSSAEVNKDSSTDVRKSLKQDEGKYPLEQNTNRFDSRLLQDYDRKCRGRNLSDEISSSAEVNKDSSTDVRKSLKQDKGEYPLEQNTNRFDSRLLQDYDRKCRGRNLSDEISSSAEVNKDSSTDVRKSLKQDEGEYPSEQNTNRFDSRLLQDYDWKCRGRNLSDEYPSSNEFECHAVEVSAQEVNKCMEWDDTIPLEECHGRDPMEVGENTEGIKSRYLVPENDVNNQNISRSLETPSRSAGQTTEVDEDVKLHIRDVFAAAQSSLSESIASVDFITSDSEHMEHSRSPQDFGRTSSVDTLGSSPLVDPITDLSIKREDMFKSPTIGTYYAYDGSVSSYDGTDDQIPNHVLQPSRRKFELPETKRCDHDSGNRTRLVEERISYSPFSSGDFTENHDNGNGKGKSVSYQHNLSEHYPGFYSPDKPSYSEPDKMDLLRMVYELKDQLNRMHFSNEMSNGRSSAIMDETYIPSYDDHIVPERETRADLNHQSYQMRHGQVQGWPGQYRASRMPYPGDAAHYSHQASCSCVHCLPQDWHCSRQFPSHSMSYDSVHSRASSSSTPRHYMSSEVSLVDDEMKKSYSREKNQVAKRHIRAIAGGAPLVACYQCSELLQLPANFLIFKKRTHRLRCNACREVLRFSLLKGTNIVQCIPDVFASPQTETDNYNDATSKRNPIPIAHSDPRSNAQHVQYSDDYELSCRNGSTEGEASLKRFSYDRVQMNASDNKITSVNESMGVGKMKTSLRESETKKENLANADESTSTSSKMSKWKKESAELEGSPLHQLMGYSSLSQVFK